MRPRQSSSSLIPHQLLEEHNLAGYLTSISSPNFTLYTGIEGRHYGQTLSRGNFNASVGAS